MTSVSESPSLKRQKIVYTESSAQQQTAAGNATYIANINYQQRPATKLAYTHGSANQQGHTYSAPYLQHKFVDNATCIEGATYQQKSLGNDPYLQHRPTDGTNYREVANHKPNFAGNAIYRTKGFYNQNMNCSGTYRKNSTQQQNFTCSAAYKQKLPNQLIHAQNTTCNQYLFKQPNLNCNATYRQNVARHRHLAAEMDCTRPRLSRDAEMPGAIVHWRESVEPGSQDTLLVPLTNDVTQSWRGSRDCRKTSKQQTYRCQGYFLNNGFYSSLQSGRSDVRYAATGYQSFNGQNDVRYTYGGHQLSSVRNDVTEATSGYNEISGQCNLQGSKDSSKDHETMSDVTEIDELVKELGLPYLVHLPELGQELSYL